jgi:mannose-6-phosphate isomerase-like protein (cupin superfamily)
MLVGELTITFGTTQHPIKKDMALFVPGGVLFGVKNEQPITASYVLTFNPPPDVTSVDHLKKSYRKNDRTVLSANESTD